MLRASDLLVIAAVVSAVVWLDVPKLLLPLLVLALVSVSMYRWRREGSVPMAAERYRARLVASCVLLAAISIPLILRLVPPNGVYGFRTSVTRSSVAIWYSANAFMGWALLVGACVSAAGLVYLPTTSNRALLLAAFLVPLLGAVMASFLYLHQFN
jgi:uncharacterized membrane protein